MTLLLYGSTPQQKAEERGLCRVIAFCCILLGTKLLRKISFLLKMGFILCSTRCLQAYEPASLVGRYQTGIIDWSAYYKSSGGGGGWMPKMADYYGGRDNANAILGVRRSIVPSAMVDWSGDLYTVSLTGFLSNGPVFWLAKHQYSNGAVTQTKIEYEPWCWAFGKDNLNLSHDPNFQAQQWEESYFKRGVHNLFHPCIVEEVETPGAASSIYVRIFHYVPNCRTIRPDYSDLPDFEGGIWVKFGKSNFSIARRVTDNRDDTNQLAWNKLPRNYSEENSKAFPNCPGTFQGFHLESSPFYSWIFHTWWPKVSGDQTNGIHCIRYNSSNHARKGVADVVSPGGVGIDSSATIFRRFIKIGNYVYFGASGNGYIFRLHRITPNQANNDNVGTLEYVGYCVSDWYTETTSYGHSWSPYDWDFCILEKDGTPSTALSTGSDKILCVFSLGGGGSYTNMSSSYNWSSTYVNWTYNYAVGVISSCHFNSTGWEVGTNAYAQNTIYVTDHKRASNTYVNIQDTSKSDEYRLYLNSHKMVPYTSPSGRHYLIYAYCYPGKKTHLYLGYAQYTVDSNYVVRLLSKTEFKAAGNSGWGDSFGAFTDCTRIISMDLKNGHLWITFSKETGIDATGQSLENKQAAYHYNYFHILVTDLIKE